MVEFIAGCFIGMAIMCIIFLVKTNGYDVVLIKQKK